MRKVNKYTTDPKSKSIYIELTMVFVQIVHI